MKKQQHKRLFALGRVHCTPGACEAFEIADQHYPDFVHRHVRGDWGELEDQDILENEYSLAEGYRLVSRYILETGAIIYIITESDRSMTTVLLPLEY